jgi:hypothetical protein
MGAIVSNSITKTGGATFDPHEENVYFLASGIGRLKIAEPVYNHLLIAVNEINSESEILQLEAWAAKGKKIFIDSGVYNLTQEHAKAHKVSMDVALSLAPEEIDGFDKLFERYTEIYKRLGSSCWGFIELDQGGRENKIKTRARLEGMGVKPIPVYHPFNDGWDYFDYLAERYDRICFGNVVQADRETRKRLVATAWERHRKYPKLWIHLLGLTPNQWLNAMPINSGDSSSWLSCVRWTGGYREKADGHPIGALPRNFAYKYGADAKSPEGADKAVAMSAYGSYIQTLNWRNHIKALENLGCEVYPQP